MNGSGFSSKVDVRRGGTRDEALITSAWEAKADSKCPFRAQASYQLFATDN